MSESRLTPTAEIVLRTLEHEGPLTRQELLARSDRCESAIDAALDDLEKRDRIDRARKSDNLREIVLDFRDDTDP